MKIYLCWIILGNFQRGKIWGQNLDSMEFTHFWTSIFSLYTSRCCGNESGYINKGHNKRNRLWPRMMPSLHHKQCFNSFKLLRSFPSRLPPSAPQISRCGERQNIFAQDEELLSRKLKINQNTQTSTQSAFPCCEEGKALEREADDEKRTLQL